MQAGTQTQRWTSRAIVWGRGVFETRVWGVPIKLVVQDCGGQLHTLATWYVARRAVVIIEAGQS